MLKWFPSLVAARNLDLSSASYGFCLGGNPGAPLTVLGTVAVEF